jgi:SpoVK/Ycf46/Vps4 family AAA+-type ATPase
LPNHDSYSITKPRGDTESFLLTLFNDCISTGRQLILVDDIDNLAPNKDRISTVTDNYILSTLICGIDTIIQKHNRENSHRKIFIVATSGSDKRVSDSLLVPHRLGDDSKIIKLSYPSQKQRLNIIHCLLRCEGINITWDFDRDGYGKHFYSTKRNVQQLMEGCDQSHQHTIEKSGAAESNESANIFNLSLTLSNRTQVPIRLTIFDYF